MKYLPHKAGTDKASAGTALARILILSLISPFPIIKAQKVNPSRAAQELKLFQLVSFSAAKRSSQ